MKPIEIIAQDLFDKVRSRFTNLQMGDESGAVTADPKAARFFDFDFVAEETTLGRVSISINDIGNLKIFFSQGITENADPVTSEMWYDFLKEMRYFAKRRLLRFDTRDITKGNLDKTDFQYLAQNGNKDPNMTESAMFGSTKTSHRKVEDTDLIIRHSEAIDPTKPGARSRKIKNLFIQNKEGERFKFPFVYLPGARAMQRHVANGGYPHDEVGKHVIKTCEEILKLSDFGRKVKHATLNDNAHGIIERAGTKLKSLRNHLESMSKQGYYESWCENYMPEENSMIEMDDATFESYKDTFTINKFDESLRDIFPILHAIMQEANEIDLTDIVSEEQEELTSEDTNFEDEFSAFESWTDSVVEGSLEPDALMALAELLQNNPDLTVGADGTAGSEALEGIGIVNDKLADLIAAKAGIDPNALLKDVVGEWLATDDPEAAQELGLIPAPAEPMAQEPVQGEVPAEQPVAEDSGDVKHAKETLNAWMADAGQKIAAGKFKDWIEVSGDLQSYMDRNYADINPDTADRIAKRMFTHDTLAQYRVKPKQDMEKEIPQDNDDDDDSAFLSKLRQQARGGSIKPGADTGEKDEDAVISSGEETQHTDEDIWKAVEGFLDKEQGTWTKGRPGIVAHCNREFGKEGGRKAAKAIMVLSKKYPMQDDADEGYRDYNDNRRGFGRKEREDDEYHVPDPEVKEGPNKSDVPAYKRKQQGGDWKMSTKDLEDEKTKSPTSSAGLARKKQELDMSEDSATFEAILKLAGLTKQK